jgi:hypothetical protein
MNHLNSPNFILNNWLYDIWGYEQMPDGIPVRRQAHGVYLDWDTSNTTVKDNWIYNYKGNAVAKVFGGNWNVVIADNQSSDKPITPPFVAEVGPGGTATNGIDMVSNKLTGSIVHYTDSRLFDKTGTWMPKSKVGIFGLFVFNYLVGTAAVESQARYTLPITEDGTYQISLLYSPGSSNASNAPITIVHADGTANISWDMQQGSKFGFAVAVGTYRFEAGKKATVTLSTTGANGDVIADSVGFVKVDDKRFIQDNPQTLRKINLEGILVDEKIAQIKGDWIAGKLDPILGDSYLHDGNKEKGSKSIIFDATVPHPGKYKVKLLYTAHDNRASNTPVTVRVGDYRKTFKVNQKQSDGAGFLLGSFDIQKSVAVEVSNDSTDGCVVVDGVQIVEE